MRSSATSIRSSFLRSALLSFVVSSPIRSPQVGLHDRRKYLDNVSVAHPPPTGQSPDSAGKKVYILDADHTVMSVHRSQDRDPAKHT